MLRIGFHYQYHCEQIQIYYRSLQRSFNLPVSIPRLQQRPHTHGVKVCLFFLFTNQQKCRENKRIKNIFINTGAIRLNFTFCFRMGIVALILRKSFCI